MSVLLSAVRALLAALAITAIGQQFLLHIGASYSTLNFFSYFTNLSNLFAAFVLLLSVFPRSLQTSSLDVMRYISAVSMAVVGIVFAVLLRNEDLGALRRRRDVLGGDLCHVSCGGWCVVRSRESLC